MGYVKASTNNPLGQRPWNAMLQPGGLGALPARRRGLSAFFPNAEAIGANAVMIDRDASNPGWHKNANAGGSAMVPRIYYPPDARKQYTTPRTQGLGDVTSTPAPAGPAPARPSYFSRLFGSDPIFVIDQSGANPGTTPVLVAAPATGPANTTGITAATAPSGASVAVDTSGASVAPATAPATTSISDWLSGTNATLGLPNYAIAAGLALAVVMVIKKK